MRPAPTTCRAHGFSLVEVMVALIVICVGMLGIAKLEAVVLSSTGSSRTRALVAMEASSLAASMHANRDFWDGTSASWNAGTASLSVVGTQTAGSMSFSGNPSTLTGDLSPAPNCETGGAAPCSVLDLAAYQLNQWGQAVAAVLRNSTTNINCAQNTGVVTCTIQIQWQENTVAANAQEAQQGAPTAFATQTYQLVVQP